MTTLGLGLYKTLMGAFSPFVPLLFRHRQSKGKEVSGRLNERQARDLPPRPAGTLIWMHGASIGESKLLLGLSRALAMRHPEAHFLFTSQTVSASDIINASLPEKARHQMLPIDTPGAAARFITHWCPDLCLFAEGEIWPNLLMASRKHGAKTALINARMTAKSLQNWQKAPRTAREIFTNFDLIIAADTHTANGLSDISARQVESFGNLKIALAASDGAAAKTASDTHSPVFANAHVVLLGASTHAGEESLLLEALDQLPASARLILAPRHPARGDDIEALIKAIGRPYARRSRGDEVTPDTQILLADTFGDMPLWYRAAHLVYLGGGHKPGIGGHTPLEPLAHFLPILTGPHTDNFTETHNALKKHGWVQTVRTANEIATCAAAPTPLPETDIRAFFKTGQASLTHTLLALDGLLNETATP